MLKLKFQYFGHLMQRANSLEKTPILGKTEGRRRSGQQRMRWLGGITDSMDMSVSKLRDVVKDRKAWSQNIRHDWVTEQQQLVHWTVMLSNHLVLCCPLLLPSIFPNIREGLFQWVGSSHLYHDMLLNLTIWGLFLLGTLIGKSLSGKNNSLYCFT